MGHHSEPDKSPSQNEYGNFFIMKASVNDMWQFFNPMNRNWEFLRVRKLPGKSSHSVILRNGWVVRTLRKGRPPFYYHVKECALKNLNPSLASSLAYKNTAGLRVLELSRTPEGLVIDMNSIFLPQQSYSDLIRLGELRNILEENTLLIPYHNLGKVSSILNSLGINIVIHDESLPIESDEKSDTVASKISKLLTLLYSRYLKKESEIEYLQVALLTRDFSRIIHSDVKSELETIYDNTERSKENSVIAKFLSNNVVSFFDWKDLNDLSVNSTIEGTILQTVSKEYIGKWHTNYYKIIVPELESVLYLQTTISPTKYGIGKIHPLAVRLNKIALDKWRIYSYLGKLKNTGTNENVRFSNSEKAFIDSSFNSILGIPSIERILRKMCFLDSFKLDLEEWKGAYDLTRYFIAYVKVKETIEMSSKTPCTIVEDFFGNTFKLEWDFETYEHYKEDIHSIQTGGYISILLENKLNNMWNEAENIDFETVYGLSFRFVRKDEFILANVFAMIKYLGLVPVKEISDLVESTYLGTKTSTVLKYLEEKDLIVVRNDVAHYLYQCLTREQLISLLEVAEQPDKHLDQSCLTQRWYILWSLMRENVSSIHPLIYSESIYEMKSTTLTKSENYQKILDFCNEVKEFQKTRADKRYKERTNYLINLKRDGQIQFYDTLVGNGSEEKYANHCAFMLKMFGQATVKARGRWIGKAHNIVKYVTRRFSYMEPSVKRVDKTSLSPEGKKVKEAEFQIEIFKLS